MLIIFQIGRPAYRNGDNIFEERNDEDDLIFGQKVPIGGAVSKDVLGPDVEDERDILPPATEAPAQNDPLYVVHYVPRGHQEATSAPPVPSPAPDVLSKILQSGKGTGKKQKNDNTFFLYRLSIFIFYTLYLKVLGTPTNKDSFKYQIKMHICLCL